MDSIIKIFLVEGNKWSLKGHDTSFSGKYVKDEADNVLESLKKDLADLQEKLYASKKYSVLIIFQAMDAAGKDSVIEHVMSGINPQGCQVHSFKQPGSEDYLHDFLWRHYKALPEKSKIGIHNRSHYEYVLACKVHPELVMKENPAGYKDVTELDKDFWDTRYESIRNFEKHIAVNDTVVIKFFLNISREEQKKRFLDRINDPSKNWKFSSLDLQEREHWDEYMKAYEQALSETSTRHAPWYVIPADKKWFTRIAVCKIIVETLKALNLKIRELSEEEITHLAESRKKLTDL